jgi:hypothetical protein
LEEVECRKPRDEKPSLDVGYENVLKQQNDYSDDESNNDDEKVNLLTLQKRELPCPQEYREQFEHPSTREFIGFDLSWIRSSATKICSQSLWILVLALVSHSYSTLTAFLR